MAKKKKKKKPKRKADVFQRVFESIIDIIQELWFERNTDRHNPIQSKDKDKW